MSDEDMRMVDVLAFSEHALDQATDVLEDSDLDYVVSDFTDSPEASALVSVLLPAETVEHVQRRLERLDIHDDIYTVVVDPEAVVSDRFDDDQPYTEVRGLGYQGISRSELHARATDLMPDATIYVLLTAISAVVAAAGVLLGSLPVLVGSMVIAPLIGPIMASGVATIINDDGLFGRSLRYQLLGGAVGVASAVAFSLLVRFTSLASPEFSAGQLVSISSHTAPNLLLVVVALAAGFAGALSLSTGGTIDLVGVMIAAAVMPPIGVTGVAVAWGQPAVVVGSAAVVLVNIASVSLAAVVSLWYLGYHPESLRELRKARSTVLLRVAVLVVTIVVLAALLGAIPGAGLPPLPGPLP